MKKILAAMAMSLAVTAFPATQASAAPVCVPLPVSTPGVTIRPGGRIPATSDYEVCVDSGTQLNGLPEVRQCGDVCVAIDVPGTTGGGPFVSVAFSTDDERQVIDLCGPDSVLDCGVTGDSTPAFCVSVGRPADESCAIHVSIDPEVIRP